MTSVAVMETVTRSAPLGLELIDAASGRRVGDGLIVRVAPVGRPQRVVIADANPSGLFVAHDLPGLGDCGGCAEKPRAEVAELPAGGAGLSLCRGDRDLFDRHDAEGREEVRS